MNAIAVVESISELSGVDELTIIIGVEMSGDVVRVIVYVSSEEDQERVLIALKGIEKGEQCEKKKGILSCE